MIYGSMIWQPVSGHFCREIQLHLFLSLDNIIHLWDRLIRVEDCIKEWLWMRKMEKSILPPGMVPTHWANKVKPTSHSLLHDSTFIGDLSDTWAFDINQSSWEFLCGQTTFGHYSNSKTDPDASSSSTLVMTGNGLWMLVGIGRNGSMK